MSAMPFEQLALDLDGPAPDDAPPSLIERARAYWAPGQLAAIVLNKPGSDVYRRTVTDAVASRRGAYGGGAIDFQTVARGVQFGRLTAGSPGELVTFRALWDAVRAYAADRFELAQPLVVAVVAHASANQARWQETHLIHERTMHPTDEDRALLDHHCQRVTDAFRARCAAVDAFWADLA